MYSMRRVVSVHVPVVLVPLQRFDHQRNLSCIDNILPFAPGKHKSFPEHLSIQALDLGQHLAVGLAGVLLQLA